ncbi:methylmalonyl-CoA epimerase [Weeksellaceae bacterium KMM 9724]|uniref:methylmalonyl-CoA epimerase n=1 Tax=Profundicola chukchiensis TaxID=2961959 RepID=UPI00243DD0AE|nr:methylmalonyl-CoA epimerase [Profundicola chukchiensis]MDG4949329.1 methylmalonyl-CoA epimerase [Profundicola chukchiensis]
MRKIEHLGIAVNNLEEANELYTKLLGVEPYKQESVEREGVTTSFFKIGESKIELLEASNPESPIAKFLEKRGQGIHHIAYAVDDIKAEMKRLQDEGFVLLSDEPKPGADGKVVVFLHPKSSGGVLVELCMDQDKYEA